MVVVHIANVLTVVLTGLLHGRWISPAAAIPMMYTLLLPSEMFNAHPHCPGLVEHPRGACIIDGERGAQIKSTQANQPGTKITLRSYDFSQQS